MSTLLKGFAKLFQDRTGQPSNSRFNSTMIIVGGILYPYLADNLNEMTIAYSLGMISLGLGNLQIAKATELKLPDSPKVNDGNIPQ